MLDIARGTRKPSKREKEIEKQGTRKKSNNDNECVWFCIWKKYVLFQNIVYKNLVYTIKFVLQCSCVVADLIPSNGTPTPIENCTGSVDVVI